MHIASGSHPDPGFPIRSFPANVVNDGRLYSFVDRIWDTRNEVNLRLPLTASAMTLQKGITGYTGGVLNNRIVVFYEDRDPADEGIFVPARAVVNISMRPGGDTDPCFTGAPVRSAPTDTRIRSGYIRIPEYTRYHTADERALWEACAGVTNPNVNYLCSKDHDVESIVMHELGHVLGLAHPQDVPVAVRPQATDDAHCLAPTDPTTGRQTDRSMMCPTSIAFTTHRRTLAHLHNHDDNSLTDQMRNQL